MREFYLTDLMCREDIDLKKYQSVIQLAVQTVLDDLEEDDIIVEEKRFVILDHDIQNEEAREIGRLLVSTPLGNFCINRPVLFVGRNRGKKYREYVLADTKLRDEIDLTKYKKLIRKTIHQVIPDIKVKVKPDKYILEKDAITNGQAGRIGRLMAQTELYEFARSRIVLFEGKEIFAI